MGYVNSVILSVTNPLIDHVFNKFMLTRSTDIGFVDTAEGWRGWGKFFQNAGYIELFGSRSSLKFLCPSLQHSPDAVFRALHSFSAFA